MKVMQILKDTMKKQTTARLTLIEKEINDLKKMIAESYYYCAGELEIETLENDLKKLLHEKNVTEIEIKRWN